MESVGADAVVPPRASRRGRARAWGARRRPRLEAARGTLAVGAGSVLGAHASLSGAVTVGRECVVGDWARAEGDARLEDRARLAAHAVALAGTRMGAGAVA